MRRTFRLYMGFLSLLLLLSGCGAAENSIARHIGLSSLSQIETVQIYEGYSAADIVDGVIRAKSADITDTAGGDSRAGSGASGGFGQRRACLHPEAGQQSSVSENYSPRDRKRGINRYHSDGAQLQRGRTAQANGERGLFDCRGTLVSSFQCGLTL